MENDKISILRGNMQRKQRRQPRRNPTLKSRRAEHTTFTRAAFSAESMILVILAMLTVLMCGVYYVHFTTLMTPQLRSLESNAKQVGRSIQGITPQKKKKKKPKDKKGLQINKGKKKKDRDISHDLLNQPSKVMPHLYPRLPILPVFPKIQNAEKLMHETLKGNPTIAGIVALLQDFVSKFHSLNVELSSAKSPPLKILRKFFNLVEENLLPFDVAYRGKTIFPIREDDSIFLSLASFREHLLKQTLVEAFGHAKNPDKLFVGAVVQNCFGKVDENGNISTEGEPCRTGFVVVGKNAQGRDQTKVSDAPPDVNGIEQFCALADFKKYCDSGQVRVMHVHEPESIGPAMARYYASKLWGGETYFTQTDSHLQFAQDWDEKYINEVKATKNYPLSVLSSYPPGFSGDGTKHQAIHESNGARLCSCTFSDSPIEQQIIRINTGASYSGNESRPKQIAFIAAGFFFARAEFLRDVPFDPFLPWCFMGEEIALSVRAWTSGWNIYAPRKNLIIHQYRPGRMGLPKFWEGVNRLYRGSGADNNSLQGRVVQRVKKLVRYPESSTKIMKEKNELFILKEMDHYGLGSNRTLEDYMALTKIDVVKKVCGRTPWCSRSELD